MILGERARVVTSTKISPCYACKTSQNHMFSKELLKDFLRCLPVLVPFYKPPGICTLRLRESIRHDIHFALWEANVRHGEVEVSAMSYLEPFADGVLTLRFGPSLARHKKLVLAENIYRATVEFGIEHEFNIIDGQFLARVEIDNLTVDALRQSLHKVEFQTRNVSIPMSQRIIDRSPNEVARLYNIMPHKLRNSSIHQTQRYQLKSPLRQTICDRPELLEFNKPYAELMIRCQGPFSVRNYIRDLADRLKTKATLVRLTRIKEGPISLDDLRLLRLHEMGIEHYVNRIRPLNMEYINYEPRLDEQQVKLLNERALKGNYYRRCI